MKELDGNALYRLNSDKVIKFLKIKVAKISEALKKSPSYIPTLRGDTIGFRKSMKTDTTGLESLRRVYESRFDS